MKINVFHFGMTFNVASDTENRTKPLATLN